ncbi:ABC transporter permease [Futiania mangrovi]|uniref:ABC transporter permease n=1 Tax=Futiania mangrovi TaxID=2959716 RepID=A0A9J6PBA5_9PROT|nr:ABC transporter permease [Futiania mangrovii]MCP1335430.1 ABC transporter permease [Futiania mangrovii]
MDMTAAILATVVTAATPLLLAALGELIVEKSGVLNLGVEGMMLAGAVGGFIAASLTGSLLIALVAAVLAGMAMSLVFAVLVLGLRANQVASGLALVLFGVGLSSLAGQGYVGQSLGAAWRLFPESWREIPFVGPALLAHGPVVYLSIALVPLTVWFLYRTRAGLILRAVGENHDAAHGLGHDVVRTRTLAILWGGALAGLGGAYLSLDYTPMWAENMTAGRGWIALALVVFAAWRPWRLMAGAYLFGGITILQLHAQGAGFGMPSQVLSMLPYLATVAVLVIISSNRSRLSLAAPGSLNKTFHPPA